MKFRNIAEIIKSVNLNNILLEYKNYKYLYNSDSKKLLRKILEIPSINNKYGKFLLNNFLNNSYEIYERTDILIKIEKILIEIKKSCEMFIENFNEIYPLLDDTSISIKLPETKDLKELGNYYIKIDKAINNIIANDKINGNLKFINSDVGSIWVDLTVGTSIALILLGNITNSAYVIQQQKLKLKLIEQEYEKNGIEIENLKILKESNEMLLKAYVNKEIKYIMDSNFSETDDPELRNRVKKTITSFSELIEKGMEIHPSIDAAQKIKIEYPDFKNPLSIASKIKEIENKQ